MGLSENTADHMRLNQPQQNKPDIVYLLKLKPPSYTTVLPVALVDLVKKKKKKWAKAVANIQRKTSL